MHEEIPFLRGYERFAKNFFNFCEIIASQDLHASKLIYCSPDLHFCYAVNFFQSALLFNKRTSLFFSSHFFTAIKDTGNSRLHLNRDSMPETRC